MGSITIRDVPPEAHDELRARAARAGQSLQEYLRQELLALSRRPDPAAFMERVRNRKRATDSQLPAEDILHLRGADRR